MKKQYLQILISLGVVSFCTVGGKAFGQGRPAKLGPDTLYVTDEADGTVKSFNANDGTRLGFTTQNGGNRAPMGLFVAGGELVVANQNATKSFPGEILQYLLRDGKLAGPLVNQNDQDAPWAPRGIILLKGVLYASSISANADPLDPGAIYVFAGDGKLLGKIAPPPSIKFYPRGIVFNPRDGLLYVSNLPNATVMGPGNGGQVLKFDPNTFEYKGIFIDDLNPMNAVNHLNRPDGLVFGPDGKLYITSFVANPNADTDIDSIRIYDSTGAFLDSISLDPPGLPERAYAQALIFGPNGKLYVPISGGGPSTGEIRSYDVATKEYDIFVPTGSLGMPYYLTFGGTDPATLGYTWY